MHSSSPLLLAFAGLSLAQTSTLTMYIPGADVQPLEASVITSVRDSPLPSYQPRSNRSSTGRNRHDIPTKMHRRHRFKRLRTCWCYDAHGRACDSGLYLCAGAGREWERGFVSVVFSYLPTLPPSLKLSLTLWVNLQRRLHGLLPRRHHICCLYRIFQR